MAGGKQTPRQKLIGMMYLVLTALLALNVSVEVLDGIVSVDDGLRETNKNFQRNLDLLYRSFEQQKEENPTRAEEYYNNAQEVRQMSDDLVDYILNARTEMIAVVDGLEYEEADTLDLMFLQAKDNYSRSSRYWINENPEGAGVPVPGGEGSRGYVLREKIEELKEQLSSLLPEGAGFQIGLDTEGPFRDKAGNQISWQEAMFNRQIPVAAAANLSRLVTEVRNAEFDVVRILFESIGADTFTFDQVEARALPKSELVISGDAFEADVVVAAFDSKQEPQVVLNGQPIEGTTIRIPARQQGTHTYSGSVRIFGPDGLEEYPFSGEYVVQAPTATVSADAMNVFYIGVDNPVSVSVPGIASDNVEPRISGRGNQILPRRGGGYVVRLSQEQDLNQRVTITLLARLDGQLREMGQQDFRVRRVPDPNPEIAGQSEGSIAREMLAGQPIIPRLRNFDFEMDFRITSFTMNTTVAGDFLEWRSTSNTQTPQMTEAIRNATRGQRFTFENIRAVGDDGRERNLPPMVFRIQ